MQKKQVSKGI